MASITLVLALTCAAQTDPPIDGRTDFAVFQRFPSMFHDVTFLHEGSQVRPGRNPGDPASVTRFQSYYAYRSDGATLHDVFHFGRGDKPASRDIRSILHRRMELLDATPDREPRVRDRVPEEGPGGPGSLARTDSPERIFLAWYFSSYLGDPAEHEFATLGWEEIDGHRCLKVQMLNQPRSLLKGWEGPLPLRRFWVDLERGYPLRIEYYSGEDLVYRTEISRLERLTLPDGRALWFPAEGETSQHQGQDRERHKMISRKEPFVRETHKFLIPTVKFNQNLNDGFFSVRRHALVANDEDLRKLQRELERKPKPVPKRLPDDPESRKQRLDEALAEADRQARRLQASSSERAGVGWPELFTGGLGVILLGGVGFWYWRHR